MKKWLLILFACLAIFLVATYAFIPRILSIKSNSACKAASASLYRMLQDKNNIARWWPGEIRGEELLLNGMRYEIGLGNITVMPVSISTEIFRVSSSLYLISVTRDSTQLQWISSVPSSNNPFWKIRAYRQAKKMNQNMELILQKMKQFYSAQENIYGFEIKKTFITDTLLISTLDSCKGYPGSGFIYSLINKLRNYATMHTARQSGYPMLHISTADSIHYSVKVALPIDKTIPDMSGIVKKRMPLGTDILVARVVGSDSVANIAYQQMQHYLDDHHLKPPGLPFYSLVTDRNNEPDSTKWITKVYFPIM